MAFSNTSSLARMECLPSVQSLRDDDEDYERTTAKSRPTANRKAEIWNRSLMTEHYANSENGRKSGNDALCLKISWGLNMLRDTLTERLLNERKTDDLRYRS